MQYENIVQKTKEEYYNLHVKFDNNNYLKIDDNNNIEISIKSRPENGDANREIIKKLAKHFNIFYKDITIVSGMKSRNKIIKIRKE